MVALQLRACVVNPILHFRVRKVCSNCKEAMGNLSVVQEAETSLHVIPGHDVGLIFVASLFQMRNVTRLLLGQP